MHVLHIAAEVRLCQIVIHLLVIAETDGLFVKHATLCPFFYQLLSDNGTIFRYL
jgi:hypothetical protein